MAKNTALMTWTTSGAGDAVMRGFSGSSCGPPATSTTRSALAMLGMATSATSPTTMGQPGLPLLAVGGPGLHRPLEAVSWSAVMSYLPGWDLPGLPRTGSAW